MVTMIMRKNAPPLMIKHGKSNTPTYAVWESLKQRTLNPKSSYYSYYGGRGITICDEWLDFANFLADMGERPEGTSLDKIDNNKGYCKENCRWVTWDKQSINKRKQSRNKTGKIGVDFTPNGKYVASIRVNKKKKHLGTFSTLQEAAGCRREAEIKYYGEALKE